MVSHQICAELEWQLASYDADTDVLAAVAATVAFHGGADTDALVLRAVRRVAEVPRDLSVFQEALGSARRYPALRVATCVGVAAVAAGREGLLVPLLVQTTSAALGDSGQETPLVWCLHPWRVFQPADAHRLMPRYQPNRIPSQPASHYLRAVAQDVTSPCSSSATDWPGVAKSAPNAARLESVNSLVGLLNFLEDPLHLV
jgi:hypothetical protein